MARFHRLLLILIAGLAVGLALAGAPGLAVADDLDQMVGFNRWLT